MTLNAHAKGNDDARAKIETADDWEDGKTSTIKQQNDWFTPNNSIKNVGSGHEKNYEPLSPPIMTRQDFPYSSVSESSENINSHPNYVGSQNNKLEQTFLKKIGKINHGANNNDGIKITENDSDSSNLSNSNKKCSNTLLNFKSLPIKNNCIENHKTVSAKRKNNYAEISKKNMQTKTNSLQTNNQKKSYIKNDLSDSDCNRKNRKRIYLQDTDGSINNNSKKNCVDKMQDINSKAKCTIISVDDGKKVNDDGCNINNTCMIEAGIYIKDDKKVNNGVEKDNNNDFLSAIKRNLRKKMNVNDKYNNTSILENGISSNNLYNIVKNSNNLIVDRKEELNNLMLHMLYTQFYSSSDYPYQLKLFKLRQLEWKEKFKQLEKFRDQLLKTVENLIIGKEQQSRQFSSENNKSKLLPKDKVQIDLDNKLLNCHKRTITPSKTSNITNSRIINLDTSSQDTDAMKNIVSNVLKTSFTPTLKTPPLKVTVSRSSNTSKVVLKWDLGTNVCSSQISGNIIEYEIATIAFYNDQMISNRLETIGVVKALQLPMSCTTQPLSMKTGTIYYFAIRSRDKEKRCGPYNMALPVKL